MRCLLYIETEVELPHTVCIQICCLGFLGRVQTKSALIGQIAFN